MNMKVMQILKKILMKMMVMRQTRNISVKMIGTLCSRAWFVPSIADTERSAGKPDSDV
jgi:hypothetical protein